MAIVTTKENKKAIIEALKQSLGVVTTACDSVGITRQTYYYWLKTDEEFRQEVEDLENVTLDFAESQLFKQIKEGSTAATIFYLKTKGRKRGYIEKTELDVTNKNPDFSQLSTEELVKLLADEDYANTEE
jgi:hypothetical protein